MFKTGRFDGGKRKVFFFGFHFLQADDVGIFFVRDSFKLRQADAQRIDVPA